MSAQRSKSILQSLWDMLAWLGTILLWFITPTGAAAIWEKWAKEKVEEERKA